MNFHRIATSLMLVLASVVLCAGAAFGDDADPRGWRLVWSANPATTATLSWNTTGATKRNRLRLWTKNEKNARKITCGRNGRYSSSETTLYYHHAMLTGLKPSTTYYVELESDGKKSRKFYFITAPDKDRPFSILFGGDSRSDRNARQQINRTLALMLERSTLAVNFGQRGAKAGEILALAHGGDYVATGTNLPQWSAWMRDHELTTTTNGRLLPIIPARGNHDGGPLFNEVFGFPPDNPNYYALRIGPQVALLTLNSETSMAGKQARWLTNVLRLARAKSRWLLAQYHSPAFPAYKRPSGALQNFVPLFERFNADLVMEADGHTIKRTVPIRGGKQDKTGVVYIGEGGLGVKPRTPKKDRAYLKPPGVASSGHHVQKITFTDKELKVQTILFDISDIEKELEVFDTYTRKPRP